MFLMGAYWHITNWETALMKTAATGIWKPELFLIIATILLALGGISLLLGYKTRIGAFLLIFEIVLTAMIFYQFWAVADAERILVLLQFLNRTALCGGLLVLIGSGPGAISLGGRSSVRKEM